MFGRHWVDCSRCSTFHDQHWQHLDPVSGKVNILTPGPSKWWEKSIFLIPRCQRAEGSNGSIDASNRSPGSRFGGQCSCGLPGHMELASHSGILSFSQIDYFFICTLQIGLLNILWCRIFLPSLLTLSLWSPLSFDGSACSESTWY